MLTLTHVDRERSKSGIPESGESIGWVLDGTAFVVQNIDQLCATWLPMFFGQSKFSSFTRKLYRWGFRKINVASIPNGSSYSDNALFFGNEHFLRSDKSQLSLMRSVTAAKTRSGTAVPFTRVVLPTTESNVVETAPQVVSSVNISRSHPPQLSSAPATTGEDMASLIQQSVNLSSLLTLLSANQQSAAAVFNQPPQLINSILAESNNTHSIPPLITQTTPTDMNQMLQQLCVSAALLRASGAIQTHPQIPVSAPMILPQNMTAPALPWWMNTTIPIAAQPPAQLLPHAPMLGWPANVNRPVISLPQSLPQSVAEQERLRGVMDTFVRYCETVQQQQQQQGLPRPPPNPPPPPPT
jgi:HSF-type DNA-binding